MKKLITLFALCLIGIGAYGQKIGNLDVSYPSAVDSTARLLINVTPANSKLTSVTWGSLMKAYLDTYGYDLGTVVSYQADTTTIATFNFGGYNVADTVIFNDSTIIGSFKWEGSDTIVVTKLIGVLRDGLSPLGDPTLGIQLYWNDTAFVELGDSYTTINAAPLDIISTTVGTSDIAFANAEIPPNVWVWLRCPTVTLGRKPTYLSVSIIGHKRNLSY